MTVTSSRWFDRDLKTLTHDLGSIVSSFRAALPHLNDSGERRELALEMCQISVNRLAELVEDLRLVRIDDVTGDGL